MRQQIGELLENGLESEDNPLGALMRLSAQLVVQEALESQTIEPLGRGYYQRREADEPLEGYRNGYEPGRLRTAEGEITVQVPQVREWAEEGPYRSRLMGFLRGNSDVLEPLAVEMCPHGLSVRDIEDALRDATGDPLLSRSTVSELSESLWEDYDAFCERDVSPFEVEYLFIDPVYKGLRQWGRSEGDPLCLGYLPTRKQGPAASGPGQSGTRGPPAASGPYENCLDFIRDMVQRGLQTPVLVTTDGAPGLVRAVTEVWGKSLRQRCLLHKMPNVLDKVPKEAQAEKTARAGRLSAPTLEMAGERATEVLEEYQESYPGTMRSFNDDLDACLAYVGCALRRQLSIRTTNLLERAFQESRRRTKVILHFFTERACPKLVFSALWQTSQRWRGVEMTNLERQQMGLLRRELDLQFYPGQEAYVHRQSPTLLLLQRISDLTQNPPSPSPPARRPCQARDRRQGAPCWRSDPHALQAVL